MTAASADDDDAADENGFGLGISCPLSLLPFPFGNWQYVEVYSSRGGEEGNMRREKRRRGPSLSSSSFSFSLSPLFCPKVKKTCKRCVSVLLSRLESRRIAHKSAQRAKGRKKPFFFTLLPWNKMSRQTRTDTPTHGTPVPSSSSLFFFRKLRHVATFAPGQTRCIT